eukprot:3792814-Prymnesium_polylepis.1
MGEASQGPGQGELREQLGGWHGQGGQRVGVAASPAFGLLRAAGCRQRGPGRGWPFLCHHEHLAGPTCQEPVPTEPVLATSVSEASESARCAAGQCNLPRGDGHPYVGPEQVGDCVEQSEPSDVGVAPGRHDHVSLSPTAAPSVPASLGHAVPAPSCAPADDAAVLARLGGLGGRVSEDGSEFHRRAPEPTAGPVNEEPEGGQGRANGNLVGRRIQPGRGQGKHGQARVHVHTRVGSRGHAPGRSHVRRVHTDVRHDGRDDDYVRAGAAREVVYIDLQVPGGAPLRGEATRAGRGRLLGVEHCLHVLRICGYECREALEPVRRERPAEAHAQVRGCAGYAVGTPPAEALGPQ